MPRVVVAFDLYGTLLSTESIATELARVYDEEKASKIATKARRYQLEYTWRINSMEMYQSFSDLTRHSFRQAAAETGLELSLDQEERVMGAYNGLDTFPDADRGLWLVSQKSALEPWIFSNGTTDMIASSLKTSPSLAQAGAMFPEANIVSVESLGVFKPDPKTYKHLTRVADLEAEPGKVYLVSSNPFDVAGAIAAGLSSIWVSRQEPEWIDGLAKAVGICPTAVARGVDEAIEEIVKLEKL